MTDCIFCKIIARKMPSKIAYEDDIALAFEDINPQAPVHTLVIPKKHIPTLLHLREEDAHLMAHLVKVANKIAAEKDIAERGFRLVVNCNPESGQEVYHIHLHLLGGRPMHWP
ncbi:MAG TPA: histidine triad nucleotide-binding protein, partial [Thermodesulfovibrionales bacterium]|nr:histidine triad nucleotide-binding protein [Thermodesulfovibrionales bacterium]